MFGPTCTDGDRMGCGVDFNTDCGSGYVNVFFTKNGKQVRWGDEEEGVREENEEEMREEGGREEGGRGERRKRRQRGWGEREGWKKEAATGYSQPSMYSPNTSSLLSSFLLPSFLLSPSGWKCSQNEKTKPRTISLDRTPQQGRKGAT